jgi:tetratricopeptide (TPR) repeat protein
MNAPHHENPLETRIMSTKLKSLFCNKHCAHGTASPFISPRIFTICLGAIFLTGLSTPATSADRYELRLHDREVVGKYELLEGNVDRSIELLEKRLAFTSSHRNLAPLLINLCAAYTLKGDFDTATLRCDAAIENGWNIRTAYNNRGVMHIARGDYLTAIEDFESAAAGKRPSRLTKKHLLQARNRVDVIDSGTRVADARSSDVTSNIGKIEQP